MPRRAAKAKAKAMQRVAPQPLEPDAEPEIILPLCEPETESMDADTDAPDMLNPAPRSTANKQARTGTAIIAALQTMPPQISSKPRAMARADLEHLPDYPPCKFESQP